MAPLLGACLAVSPLETDLFASEQDRNARAIAAIEGAELGPELRFALLADSHDDYEGLRLVGDALAARGDLDFVLHAGDLTTIGLRDEYRWTAEVLDGFSTPVVVVVGNHDALANGRSVFRRMFGPFDFAFRAGPLAFVCFDSNDPETAGPQPDVEGVRALVRGASDAEGIVLLTHSGPFAQLDPAVGERERALLSEPGVVALLYGHGHRQTAVELADRAVVATASVATHRRFVIVTASGAALSFESCDPRGCQEFFP